VRFGLHALGIGPGADPEIIVEVARAAEESGFATLWSGEHVVMVEGPDSAYPYSPDGRIAVPADEDWLDPFATLTFAAAATRRIAVATGILLLPEHQPLVVAKQAASLDVLSSGRFRLGVGIGWSSAEFAALGVPFAGRARRTREYVETLRLLWRDEVVSYSGEFVRFEGVRSHPKPLAGRIPILLGGNSDAALARVAAYGDGWYGFNLSPAEVAERSAYLSELCRSEGRDPAELEIAVALREGSPGDLESLADVGVDEVVLVAAPPDSRDEAPEWVRGLSLTWGVPTEA
jgi:probable F420-dependent oxidoreductase